MFHRFRRLAAGSVALFAIATVFAGTVPTPDLSTPRFSSAAPGDDWPGYGRGFDESHYSPLEQIDTDNVRRLGLAWSLDLGPEASVTQPIAVDGVLYFATGYSIVHALDAATGRLLWRHDTGSAARAGLNLRLGWGSRGIAWWNGRIYTGTQDGRLIAIDAKSGAEVWSVQTYESSEAKYISAAPRVGGGVVLIGNAGDIGKVRGFVTAYDAETGKLAWRFYTVPGDPGKGFENEAMRMAAQTWAGEWWKYGGGGSVWNSIAYDPEMNLFFIGTGNGYPWNHKVRSAGQGDNLFVCSIIALDAKTGAYRWHYQINPAETWDYNAAMDVQLAELDIAGERRKVVMTAPKNGFFYVLDRATGRLISAEPFAKVTWASRIDLKTGRPVEHPEARYENGQRFELWPSSAGAHGWPPMAWSPKRGLVYIPVMENGMTVDDIGVDLKNWQAPLDRRTVYAMNIGGVPNEPPAGTGALLAWNPATQKPLWRVPQPSYITGGVLATAGDLVFQGSVAGFFDAYDAATGGRVWSFDAKAPVFAPPMSYSVNGRQYVSVLTGLGTSAGIYGPALQRFGVDPRSQARRVLSFALDGKATLPPRPAAEPAIIEDPAFVRDDESAARGAANFMPCALCHGNAAIAAGHAPDLRRSPIPLSPDAFAKIVRGGALEARGMPKYPEYTDGRLEDLRQYIRTQAWRGRTGESARISETSTMPGG
jgi:quinohemoprotein ethanol dehydrogenase